MKDMHISLKVVRKKLVPVFCTNIIISSHRAYLSMQNLIEITFKGSKPILSKLTALNFKTDN